MRIVNNENDVLLRDFENQAYENDDDDDVFCLELLNDYKYDTNIDKGELMSIQDFLCELRVEIDEL